MNFREGTWLGLSALLPVSFRALWLDWGEARLFVSSVLAILPLAIWLTTVTEGLVHAHGPCRSSLLTDDL